MKNDKLHIKEPGFTTPKNYFDKLESQILEEVAMVSKVTKGNPFEVPENYFNELEVGLMKQTALIKKETKVISIFRNSTFRYVASLAAVVLFIVSIFQFQQPDEYNKDSITHISNYIESGHLDLSNIDFETLLTEEMMEHFSFYSNLDQDALFDYLSYDIDESQFIND